LEDLQKDELIEAYINWDGTNMLFDLTIESS